VDHVFSLTLFNLVGCDPALLLLPITVLHLFLQKKETLRTSYSTLCPCCSFFLWRLYGLVTSALPSSIWPRRRSMRHIGGKVNQNNTFSERILSGALKGPGSGNAGSYGPFRDMGPCL